MFPRFSPDYRLSDFSKLFFSKSSSVSLLEKGIASRANHDECILFRYGRSGLYYLLKALGARGKNVVLPSYTCVTVAHAIVESGNRPKFLDCSKISYQPNPADYLDSIDSDTVMVIPTNLFGFGEDFADIYDQIKSKHENVFVLQDCAHSFFCEVEGVGCSNFGDGALYGMNISKLVNSVKGGALSLKSSKLAREVRAEFKNDCSSPTIFDEFKSRFYFILAYFAFKPILFRILYLIKSKTTLLDGEAKYFDEKTIELPGDFSQKMSSFEAEIGLKSLDRINRRILDRQKIAKVYCLELEKLKFNWIRRVPKFCEGKTWSHFPILVLPELRDALVDKLQKYSQCEIGIIVDYSVADLPSYRDLGARSAPLALEYANSVVNLPLTFFENGYEPDFSIMVEKVMDGMIQFDKNIAQRQ